MFTPLRPRLPRHAPGYGGGRPAKVSPQAQFDRCGPLFRRSLGLAPCPTHKRCSSSSSRSPASARRGPLRSPPRLRPRSVGDRRRSSRSSRAPRPAGPHLARPGALGGSPPFCRGIRSGRAGIVAALLSRRPVARCALLPPVSRPARARELARALAALFLVQLLYLSARILFLSAFCG